MSKASEFLEGVIDGPRNFDEKFMAAIMLLLHESVEHLIEAWRGPDLMDPADVQQMFDIDPREEDEPVIAADDDDVIDFPTDEFKDLPF